jgi:hypothetical protein
MKNFGPIAITIIALGLGGCARRDENDSAAREAGRTAHEVATKTEEAAKKAGEKIEKAAKEVREGWKEGEREDQAKGRK